LLLVRGFTKEAFYGPKVAGQTRFETTAPERATEEETLPLEELLTVYGGADDLDAQGQERLNINVADTTALAEWTDGILTEGDVQAIVDYRGSMGAFDSIGELLRVEGITREKMQQAADLLTTRSRASESSGAGSTTGEQPPPGMPTVPGPPDDAGQPTLPGLGGDTGRQAPGGETPGPPGFPPPTPDPEGPTPPQPSTSNVADIDLAALPEAGDFRPNILNLNTAPPETLATLEGMTEQVLNAIADYREAQSFTTRGDLLALKEMDEALFAQLVEAVTVRSSTLRITAIGSVDEGRIRVRVTAVVDLKQSEPRIVYLQAG